MRDKKPPAKATKPAAKKRPATPAKRPAAKRPAAKGPATKRPAASSAPNTAPQQHDVVTELPAWSPLGAAEPAVALRPGREPRTERLQKALARAGVASRRAAEVMIAEGRVRVNDKVITTLGTKIDPVRDQVRVDGRQIGVTSPELQQKVYFLLNKPTGFLTTTKDDRGRKTVMDLVVGASEARIYPVGRLDFDAEGALLLTNDGELANLLTHPRYHVPKTYQCKVKGVPPQDKLDKLRRGIYLEDGPTKPAHIEVISNVKKNTWVEITVTEGRNRLIKRMFWRIEHPVLKLVRTRFGALDTEGLEVGEYRELSHKELKSLREFIA